MGPAKAKDTGESSVSDEATPASATEEKHTRHHDNMQQAGKEFKFKFKIAGMARTHTISKGFFVTNYNP